MKNDPMRFMIKPLLSKRNKDQAFLAGVTSITVTLVFVIVMVSSVFGDPKIKEPNVSGQFYDASPLRLSAKIDKFLADAKVEPSDQKIDILIAPHAGYVYSGGVAAYGFKAASRQNVKTAVILAPSHQVAFDGISVWEEGGFRTPLGLAEVDEVFAKKLIDAADDISYDPRAFAREHSLEVEIPFIQKTFENAKIVPVVLGQPRFETLQVFAAALNDIIGTRDDVLIVVSTDLSHYHDDETARNMDRRTIEAVKTMDIDRLWSECQRRTMEMCGYVPVSAALLYAKERGLTDVDVLRYAHSGDVTGDNDRVVGYTSIVIYGKGGSPKKAEAEKNQEEGAGALTLEQKRRLIAIARETVETFVRTGKKPDIEESDPRLTEVEGAFVTLHRKSYLRGCIGNIIGRNPLYKTVRDMAVAAASQDPRFPPVKPEELDQIEIEVSVLSKPWVITDVGVIELGKHGVIVSRGPWNQGVFLPQVGLDTGWTKEGFLSELCSQKAHLPRDCWKDPKTKIEIFTATVFNEKNVRE